ncbi:hypothetical protein [Amycolatopsis sp. NPDC006125]|uniref:hypothetical protein n=1 Tax=Amycolatopsis sp. NPDC006125 TaxID=3156730 RepID=UPI0033AC0E71
MRWLAADTDLWADATWIVDSTPVECGRSLPTVKRSDLAGWAKYGFCRSHSRWFWGLRLHLLAEDPGLLIMADKGYVSRELDHYLTERGVRLIRPSYRNRKPHPG